MKLHVIMACHNRRDLTTRAMSSALAAASFAGIDIDFTVFDDGSSDGTAETLSQLDRTIAIVRGDGSAFWAKGMASAELAVLKRLTGSEEPDLWIVWLNDDVILDASSFVDFRSTVAVEPVSSAGASVYVGAMRDPLNGTITYGGLFKTGWHPLRFAQATPGIQSSLIDSFNGNLVFVPTSVARNLGGIDGQFSHALADIDYGLRCGRSDVPVKLLPGSYGLCPRNPPEPNDGLFPQWRRFVGVKGGGNFMSLRRILYKGAPRIWPVYVGATYFLWWARRLLVLKTSSSERIESDRIDEPDLLRNV